MSKQPQNHTLLEDLEAIQKSLDKISKSEPVIPTLEEIVGHRAPTTVNPKNPFLSSQSLSELISIRNEAETHAAQELARITPVRPIEEILKEEQPKPSAPDPSMVIEQMEHMFESWIESAVNDYMSLFESELRNRLQQDFKTLVTQWYKDHDLPIPEGFERSEDSEPKDEQ
ncbi:hypothetical protein QWZ13_13510 [Reinekea marina]|uniref:Uncharacterized protein n=1 Tax=Reinekea marina TaxID=1310421 RepID=A0ABV7WPE6_9GAMM|nr:hypothetical protein [Reinekea marina]MDN3649932.1 hypothetical protein [Reinekea marina]